MKNISVSVISGKSPENMKKCLQTLKNALTGFEYTLIITDNCADWDVKKIVNPIFPEALIIKNDTPSGFGKNHNNALLDKKDEFSLIINDDIEMDADTCKELICLAEKEESGVLFGPILFPRSWEAEYIAAGGKLGEKIPKPILTAASLIIRLFAGKKIITSILGKRNRNKIPKDEKKAYISGACCLVKRQYIDEYGLFDPEYYMYYDDIDLGKRIYENGYECWQAGRAKVMHLEGGSFSQRTWEWISDSALRYSRKYHSLPVTFLTQILLSILKLLLKFKPT